MRQPRRPRFTKGKNAMPAFLGRLPKPDIADVGLCRRNGRKGLDLICCRSELIGSEITPAFGGLFLLPLSSQLTLAAVEGEHLKVEIFGISRMSYSLGSTHGHAVNHQPAVPFGHPAAGLEAA